MKGTADICEDYGVRVEKSVFECDLRDGDFNAMWNRLSAVVNPDVDRVIDYPIGMIAKENIRELGQCVHCEKELTYVF